LTIGGERDAGHPLTAPPASVAVVFVPMAVLVMPPVTMPVVHVIDVVAVLDRFVTASFAVLVIAVVLMVAVLALLLLVERRRERFGVFPHLRRDARHR
jgi:hypothetical protein